MTIKEFSARTGVTADTLRYYERVGIIPAVPRKAGGVRVYDENFVEWINFVQTLKASGMSLEAIADYIRLAKLGEATCQQRKKKLTGAGTRTAAAKNRSIAEHGAAGGLPADELRYGFAPAHRQPCEQLCDGVN